MKVFSRFITKSSPKRLISYNNSYNYRSFTCSSVTPISFYKTNNFCQRNGKSQITFHNNNYNFHPIISHFRTYSFLSPEEKNKQCLELFQKAIDREVELNYQKSLRHLSEIIQIDPRWHPRVYLKKASAEVALRLDNQALSTYFQLFDYFPTERICFTEAIKKFEFLKKKDEAIQIYQRYEQAFPLDVKLKNTIADYLMKAKRYNEAIDYYFTLQKSSPKQYHFEKGICFMRLGQPKFAIECFDDAIKNNLLQIYAKKPDFLSYFFFHKSKAHVLEMEITKAIEELEKAYKYRPNVRVSNIMANLHLKTRNFDEGLNWANISLQKIEDNIIAMQIKGYCLLKLEKIEESNSFADEIMNAHPNHYYGYHYKGVICQVEKKYKESLQYFAVAENYYIFQDNLKQKKEEEEENERKEQEEFELPDLFDIPATVKDKKIKIPKVIEDIRYNYVCMGVSHFYLNNIKIAADYFDKGYDLIPERITMEAINVYKEIGEYEKVLELAEKLLKYHRKFEKNSPEFQRVDNLLLDLIAGAKQKLNRN